VTGTLRRDLSPLDALLGAFPGGSITGAPKKRAMEIIAELEPVPRGAYCGSFFWMDNQGNLDSNILIRTLQTEGDRLYCHGGGGIVFDSVPEEEYEESCFKVAKLMGALEEQFL
jgi:para-aminobenzoate synthetase component 1